MQSLKKHPFDQFLEIFGILLVLASFILPAINYQNLPDSIPRHFNSDGLPNAYGSKGIIWLLPITGFILYLVIGVVSHIPSLINLPFKPDPERLEYFQMKYARMLRILNAGMVFLFAFINYGTIQIGLGNQTQLPDYFSLIALIFFIGVPISYVLFDFLKSNKSR
ncbi:uncharacterized protein DUF1648 [Algoriphagus boseongensis]|uniref:Uncharacterized protein DUF1648 n=1 Tax=Algoriphagus boseongensis TaxID=1442587 RepID=A0A4R6T2D3_9BACT|nr:DUF1648 domain-containing protein [Algoriphagus boseongensis]TDQ14676.1 uncharacterized protein DUF1648 [Algoriphagus boseongensis]